MVVLDGRGERLDISVSDNGRGIDGTSSEPGYGLGNMADRVDKLGGTFRLTSEAGTHIRISVPFPGRES